MNVFPPLLSPFYWGFRGFIEDIKSVENGVTIFETATYHSDFDYKLYSFLIFIELMQNLHVNIINSLIRMRVSVYLNLNSITYIYLLHHNLTKASSVLVEPFFIVT